MPVAEADAAVEKTEDTIDLYGPQRQNLIYILQDLQEEFDYLPRPALKRVAERLQTPLAEILRVVTFYAAFSLEPQGEHLISVCMGTACHVRGAPRILQALRRGLSLSEGQRTTDDMTFTVQSVRCLGCCGLAPVIDIDGTAYGRLTPERIPEILEDYE
ncbi:MAG: NAD(P)H-dependent oxidoreductase subunit E [Planctomycetota bacterium]